MAELTRPIGVSRTPTETQYADPTRSSLEGRKGKLVRKGQAHLGMLQHVVEAEVLDLVVSSVDLLVRVLELGLDDEGGWVAESAG